MKSKNIPADIKSKSLKETKEEIDRILSELEKKDANLNFKKANKEKGNQNNK